MAADQKKSPNQSLYIQNLPDKFQKDDIRRALYMLFATYGPVLDVTAMKGKTMRGQAHVLFRDVQSANQAMRACQGIEFFGRGMVGAAVEHVAHQQIANMLVAHIILQEPVRHSGEAHGYVRPAKGAAAGSAEADRWTAHGLSCTTRQGRSSEHITGSAKWLTTSTWSASKGRRACAACWERDQRGESTRCQAAEGRQRRGDGRGRRRG